MKRKINLALSRRAVMLLLSLLLIAMTFTACAGKEEATTDYPKTLEELSDAAFAISDANTGYCIDIEKELPNVNFDIYTNYFDTFIAVSNGTADTAFCFKYTFIGLKKSYPNLEYVESNIKIPIVANFSSDADYLREEFNDFVVEANESGLMEKLAEKWMYGYGELTEKDVVDFSDLKGENGTITYATDNVNIPYEYLTNGTLNGFEPAVLYEFCKAKGYKPEIIETKFDSVLAGVASGKYDMAMNGYGYTEDRSSNSNFSEPFFYDNVVYTVNGNSNENIGFFEKIKQNIQKDFVEQSRWKLLTNGLGVTIIVTVLSVMFGALLGFGMFLASYRRKKLGELALKINDILEAIPVLVVLLIFFYVIFGKSKISGVIVSVLVFGMCFMFTFFALLHNSVKGIPKEQTEAGLALGYTNRQTLFKIVLPQAMEAFIPAIKSAIVAILKGTAIVGYVAVQDLTKAGDIIRSQTFDAFIPIISVAILYFLIAKLLIKLMNRWLKTPSAIRKERRGVK